MSIDPYSLCPGGTGKKLKFCCSDLLNELGKIDHMLAAEQRQACLDYITQLETKYPDRACLLTTKALVLQSLEQDEAAQRAADQVLATQPTNPVALAVRALSMLEDEDPAIALRPLHQALAACESSMPQRVFEAVGFVAESLLSEGYVMAALAHLYLQLEVKPDYEAAAVLAYRVRTASGVPLLLKDIRLEFDPAPPGASYQAEFDAALQEARHGRWLKAAERFDALMFRAAGCAALWRNLGRLRAYVANEAGAAEALRRYASLDVPLDDAVEAEMLAQLLDPIATEATTEQVRVVYDLGDVDAVAGRLSGSPKAVREEGDDLRSDDPDEPPPRAVFTLLDRPLPASGGELTEETLPELIAIAMLYGRQTDREPRLELLCDRRQVELAKKQLQEILGEALGRLASEETAGRLPAPQFFIPGPWRAPADTPPDRIVALGNERRRKFLLQKWPREPNVMLGGKTPEQAAADRSSRVGALASIALWELNYGDFVDFNELRGQLGLPLREPLDPTSTDLNLLPLARLHRFEAQRLSNEQLSLLWRRAILFRARLACYKLAGEVAARPDMAAADRAQAHGMLASLSNSTDAALAHLGDARRTAKAAGISCAGWDLEEMAVRLSRGQTEAFVELVQHINAAHRNEPGVMERLFQFMYDAGLVDEHGRPNKAAARGPAELVTPGGAESAGKIWTPDSETGQGQKSSLWVPGG